MSKLGKIMERMRNGAREGFKKSIEVLTRQRNPIDAANDIRKSLERKEKRNG